MYQKKIIYQQMNETPVTIRQLLSQWLIPKKWQHFFRIQQDVLINEQYRPFNTELLDNDEITLNFDFPPRTQTQTYLPGKRSVDVVFENDDVLVVNKPANIKTHPNLASENDTLFNDVQAYLKDQHPYMVHRIDMLTSGLVLIAKTPYLVPIFNRELMTKTLHRKYLAIVELKQPMSESGSIDLPIDIDPDDKRKRKVSVQGLASLTDYKILRKNSQFALLELTLHSGRTHQIRVHLSEMGWPIVNDDLYNTSRSTGNMMLFAYQLNYQIPFSEKMQTVSAPIPSFMEDFLKRHSLSTEDLHF